MPGEAGDSENRPCALILCIDIDNAFGQSSRRVDDPRVQGRQLSVRLRVLRRLRV
jgi:hypothetical protein